MTTHIKKIGSTKELYSFCFWADSGCWEWKRSLIDGYGQVVVNGKTMAAHRYSFTITKGKIPEGMLVCHTCDNRKCIRPSHLFLGTYKDNSDDKIIKGRDYRRDGAANSNARLTWLDVKQIRKIGRTQTFVKTAQEFGVTPEMVSLIVRNKAWKDV